MLIDQTTLCEAARLLDDVSDVARADGPDTAERLFHLSTLLDAILLYDEVHVLDAQIPYDARRSRLRQVLLEHGIVRQVDTRAISADVSGELVSFLRGVEGSAHSPHPVASAEEVGRLVHLFLNNDDLRAGVDDPRGFILSRYAHGDGFESELFHRRRSALPEIDSDPLRVLGARLLVDVGYFRSGDAGGVVSDLRTFMYWRAAAHLRVSFLPSLYRLPVYRLMTGHIRRTVQDRVYDVVARAFRTTVAEVYADEEILPLYLPPALALFLDHLRRHGDIGAAVHELRHRHRRFRRGLRNLQRDLDTSATLGEARAARQRLAEAMRTLHTELGPDTPVAGTVEQLIDIVPDVAKVVTNPLDMDNYTEALLARPAEWLRSWWLRRPIRPALELHSRLDDLGRYDRLLEQATGQRRDRARVHNLRINYGHLLAVYGDDSRLPAALPRTSTPSDDLPE
ncbi:hypothetical protein ACIBCD_17785 [Nocardia brasiliensis]|uniref:hypothetical protein n=1 Tax=Nocardia brasiliensis TaxID=37326 RepID=UPI0037951434